MVYDVGDRPRITVVFTNLSDAATDPTMVSCFIHSPSGKTTVYTYGADADLTKSATGTYHLDFTLTEPGSYGWRFVGSGVLRAADQGTIYVQDSKA
jgi:hypothetical protein